jgi:hypothetical protein
MVVSTAVVLQWLPIWATAPFAQVVAAVSDFTRLSPFVTRRALRLSSFRPRNAIEFRQLGSLQIQFGEESLCP